MCVGGDLFSFFLSVAITNANSFTKAAYIVFVLSSLYGRSNRLRRTITEHRIDKIALDIPDENTMKRLTKCFLFFLASEQQKVNQTSDLFFIIFYSVQLIIFSGDILYDFLFDNR